MFVGNMIFTNIFLLFDKVKERDNEITILVKILKQHAKRAGLKVDEMYQLQTQKNRPKLHDSENIKNIGNVNHQNIENINPNFKLNMNQIHHNNCSVCSLSNTNISFMMIHC